MIDALGDARFPYTAGVLSRMQGLSGAHFAAYAEDGRVTASSLASLEVLPPDVRSLPAAVHVDALGGNREANVGGTRYLVASLRSSGGLRGTSLLVLYPETSWRQARWEAAMPPLMLGAGSLGLMVLATSWVAHRITARIGRVQGQVARIVDGDFREQLPDGQQDEVADLSRSINYLCIRLREMQRTIRETERSRLLAQFAAGLAHQLRNALTGARMSVQLHARRHPAPDGDQSLSVALRQLAMTEEQVKGLLSLGKVERRPAEPCDLGQIVADVAFLVDPACQHARVSLVHAASGRPLVVLVDPSGVRAALLNLALNAIEAAGPGGTVRLEATADGDEVAVVVADTGAGPPPELAESLVRGVRHQQARGGRPGAGAGPSRGGRPWRSAVLEPGGRRDAVPPRFPRSDRVTAGGCMSRILVVDDEASICWAFRESLGDEGHQVEVAASVEEGLAIAAGGPLDAVVLDVRLPGVDGLTAMGAFRDRIGPAPIIVITAFGNLETAVRAMEGGAFDYLVKPFDLDQATGVVTRALESRRVGTEAPGIARTAFEPEALVGSSPAMQELFKKIALVAPADVPVLITGESGTGKELVARAIHRHSPRRAGPFVPVSLAALSPTLVERELFGHLKGSFTGANQDRPGLLELAAGGTLLLDELGDIPPDLQVKLLRVIEHRAFTPVGDSRPRPTDIRVLAATNRPLGELMAAGRFREDLYFRLSVFPIHVPPLRDRRDDIPALAEHFLRQARLADAADARISQTLIDALRARPWTGNVRELRNAIEHAAIVARGRTLGPEHLPTSTVRLDEPAAIRRDRSRRLARRVDAAADRQSPGRGRRGSLYERFLELAEPPVLQAVMEHCRHNRAAAAEVLGIHRATLRQKLRKYGIG